MALKPINAIRSKVVSEKKHFGVTNQVIHKPVASNSKFRNLTIISRELYKHTVTKLISKLHLTTCGGLKNEDDTMTQYLQLLQLTIIPSVEYHFNKNLIKTKDASIMMKEKMCDGDEVVKLNSSAISQDTSDLLDLLLNTSEVFALRGFLMHKGLHVLCDIMDYAIKGNKRSEDGELQYQRDMFYLLKPFIENSQFVHEQEMKVIDGKQKGVVESVDPYLDEQLCMDDQHIQDSSVSSHNYWVCGSSSRRALMLLKLLDILLHLETHGVLTSTRIVQNTPRHPRYCMYKLKLSLNKLRIHEDGRLRRMAREVEIKLKLSH